MPVKMGKDRQSALISKGPGPARYMLPPVVGYENHDCSVYREPAFSLREKLMSSMFRPTPGPGPAYLIPHGVTRHGQDGDPKYTVKSRIKEMSFFESPGPAAYNNDLVPPQGEPTPPLYSMGQRTFIKSQDPSPGPAAYMLPAITGPNVINKKSTPAYSVSSKPRGGPFDQYYVSSPGPAQHTMPDSNVFLEAAPIYTMQPRTEIPVQRGLRAGPASYEAERVTLHKPRAPAYSFGNRHSEFAGSLFVDASCTAKSKC